MRGNSPIAAKHVPAPAEVRQSAAAAVPEAVAAQLCRVRTSNVAVSAFIWTSAVDCILQRSDAGGITAMFMHNKRLQYTVRVGGTDPGLANLMLEQFGGPQGELAAAMRYFTQALSEDDPGRKDMLLDIATEELSHLEVIGTIVSMLLKGPRGKFAGGALEKAELYRDISGGGNDSHVT